MSFLDQVRTHYGDQRASPPRDLFDAAHYHPGRGIGYAQAALEAEVERVTAAANGTRNHTLNRAAFSLGQLVAGGELDEAMVIRELTAAAQLTGLDDREIGPTITSGLKSGATHPRTAPPPQAGGAAADPFAPPDPEPELDEKKAWVHANLPRIDWHALWTIDDDEEWIIEPLLPARRLIALYSPPKVGKSLLMLELAVGVARGTPTLGTTLDRPRRVLYVDFENDPKGDVRERLKAMRVQPGQLDNLVYLSFPVLATLDSAQGGAQLMAAVEAYGCEVVVIDTISRAIGGEENENDTWLAFYRHTGKALKAAGVALVRLDHTGKDENRGQRGGSAKSGDVDAIWRMSKLTDTTFRLDCEAHRMPVAEKTLVLHRETTPHLHHRVDAAGRSAAWSTEVAAVIGLMDELDLPADAGADRARKAVRDGGLRARNKIIAEAVRQRKRATGVDFDMPTLTPYRETDFDADLSGTG